MVPANAYQRTKFQLPSSISSGDMEGVLKYKLGAAVTHKSPRGQVLYRSLMLVNIYKCAKFQLLSSNNFRDKEGVPSQNLMQWLLPRCRMISCTLKLVCVLQVLGKVKQPDDFSIVSLCIMQLCEYVFPI